MAHATFGFVLVPPVWCGQIPQGFGRYEPGETPPARNYGQLSDEILRRDLPGERRIRVDRDGLFLLEVPEDEMPSLDSATSFMELLDGRSAVALGRARLLNTLLTCVYTAMLAKQEAPQRPMVVTPDIIVVSDGLDGEARFSSDVVVGQLLDVRTGLVDRTWSPTDHRLDREHLLEQATLDDAMDRFAELLDERFVPYHALCELVLRAHRSFTEHDWSSALIASWAVTESLLQRVWSEHLEKIAVQEVDGVTVTVIGTERRNYLSSREAAMTTELLALQGVLPAEIYDRLTAVRKARNRWIHRLEVPQREVATHALELVQTMLRLALGIEIILPRTMSA